MASRPAGPLHRLLPDEIVTEGYMTAEHVFPWMWDDYGALRGQRDAAELLAEHPWPRLYDADRLRRNEVPVAATIYVNDLYVERDFAEETAAAIRGHPCVGDGRVRAQRSAGGWRARPGPSDRPRPRARLMAAAKATDDEGLRRLGGGRWQTRDEQFTIEPQSGTWAIVDAEQTDELGLPLVRGPYPTLTAAKAAIADARGSAAPTSPLEGSPHGGRQDERFVIHGVTEQRSDEGRETEGTAGTRGAALVPRPGA